MNKLFKKLCNRLFRKQFEATYPNAARFLNEINVVMDEEGKPFYVIKSGFHSESSLSAKGIRLAK